MLTRRALLSTAYCLLPTAYCFSKQPPSAPVNVNTATAAQLERLPGIGPARAAQIIRMRQKNGPFRSVEELRALPRLSEKQFQQLKKYVTVEAAPQVRSKEPLR